jgi:hypothetical protein
LFQSKIRCFSKISKIRFFKIIIMTTNISYSPTGVSEHTHLERAFGHINPSQQELYIRLANTAIEKTRALLLETKASFSQKPLAAA